MNGCRILAAMVLFVLIFSMTAAADSINTTVDVNEGIVLNGDIHLEVLDVGTNWGSYAKLKFYSYKDAGGKTESIYMGDVPTTYTSGTFMKIEVTLDSISYDTAFLMIESTTSLKISDRYGFEGEDETENEKQKPITVPKLGITRTFDTNRAEQGQTIRTTLTIRNTGNGTATNIVLDEDTITGAYKDGCPSTIDDIAAGETKRISYDLRIVDAQPGTYELSPAILNYESESGATYSSESSSSILEILPEEVRIPELEISIDSVKGIITCGDEFPVTVTITNVGNATTGKVHVKSDLPADVRVVDGDLEPEYESIKPGDSEEYDVSLRAYEQGKHTIEMQVMWGDSEAAASFEFWAEKSGLEQYYLYILAAIPILLLLLWVIKRRREYSY